MSSIFAVFGAMLFLVHLRIKRDSTIICVSCMIEHVCYEPFSFKKNTNLEDILC